MSVMPRVPSLACVLVLACVAAHAAADEAAASRLEIDTLQPWDPARRDTLPVSRLQDAASPATQRALPSSSTDDGLRARLWWGRGAVEVGAGADWLAPSSTGANARPWSQVVGVRANLSARTRVVYETEATLPWRAGDSAGPRTARVALEFKSKSPVANLREGLMRVQLSGDAVLQFRPRGGGMQVMYRERF
jgi:hypothetical protein